MEEQPSLAASALPEEPLMDFDSLFGHSRDVFEFTPEDVAVAEDDAGALVFNSTRNVTTLWLVFLYNPTCNMCRVIAPSPWPASFSFFLYDGRGPTSGV